MNRYARIQDGFVAELFATDDDIRTLFNPALVWIPIPDGEAVAEGWTHSDGVFAAPPVVPPPPEPTLSELQAQLQALAARIAALIEQS
jgi:hypothetical protein